ncbi:hypothetical protein M3M39_01505 [Fructilactobacillus hinvesii]|uniref:Uncharacterized protein n=1 Tax=Fructilactobacillus hinvesii TaxID=2940300 RepID=A0ABY5BTC6_9LACO|nr:hypothetical protein [Fructilactobacillus hinvesii]USS88185.1 hypothetical protein M3M39_01505 [Fructilactobacillus hinvesii]
MLLLAVGFGNFIFAISKNILVNYSIWTPRILGALAAGLFSVIFVYASKYVSKRQN